MAKLTYSEQLRHPNWQRKRLEALNAADFECQNCGEKEITLNVHHKRYIRGRMAWEYTIEELVVLCEPCHQTEHEGRELLDEILASAGPGFIDRLTGLIAGFLDGGCDADPFATEAARQRASMEYELGLLASLGQSLDVDGWRALVRDLASKMKSVTPAVRGQIESWDEEK